jgi:hypothetical protein
MASCRSCKAEIRWAFTEQGKRMPLDVDPREDGNLIVVGRREGEDGAVPIVRSLKKGEGDLTLFEPPLRYVSHFATCPDAAQHRRPR